MDATTMPAATSLKTMSFISRIRHDFPQFLFKKAPIAKWSDTDATVYYESSSQLGKVIILHELGHALLGHADYHQDIELLSHERKAWEKASEIASRYSITITDDLVQAQLDTYRTWLHERSRCPNCHSAGIQHNDLSYSCLLCQQSWHANEARLCHLRRHKI